MLDVDVLRKIFLVIWDVLVEVVARVKVHNCNCNEAVTVEHICLLTSAMHADIPL